MNSAGTKKKWNSALVNVVEIFAREVNEVNGSGTKTAGNRYEMPIREPVRKGTKNRQTSEGILWAGRNYDTDDFVFLLLNNLLEDPRDTMEEARHATR